jgi:argininosuccinate lyase
MLVERMGLDRARMARAASDDRLLATELADALAKRGVPFRRAHEMVGRRIAEAEAVGKTLRALGPSKDFGAKDLASLDVKRALGKRTAFGGTSPVRVRAAAREARKRIAARLRAGGSR